MVSHPEPSTASTTEPVPVPELQLLTELRPRGKVFLENLLDLILRRQPPRYWSRYPSAEFWPDVFVERPLAWNRLRQSALAHVLAVLAIYGLTDAWLNYDRHRHPVVAMHKIEIYNLSEYLPPMDTGSPPAPKPRKGQPLQAKQKIVSLQPNADNREQTIITPPDVKLPTNIPLPNIVAWTNTPGPPTALAQRNQLQAPNFPASVMAPAPDNITRDLSQIRIPDAPASIIAPAPEAHGLDPARKLEVNASVIAPAPSADLAKLQQRNLNVPEPSVIAPAPDANIARNLGDMNVGHLQATVAAPKLSVPEQKAMVLRPSSGPVGGRPGAGSAGGNASANSAPPIAPVGQINQGPNAGQIIALNLRPAVPKGPIAVPPGRRSGEFAAGPEGTPNAPGTPDIKASGPGPGGIGAGKAGPGEGKNDLPTGIQIGNAPGAPPPGTPTVAGTPKPTPNLNDVAKQVLMASARPTRVGDFSRETRPSATPPDSPKIEDKVFGTKKIYTLALNMPNLTSSGGSWIMRFAELDENKTAGAVSAPVATTAVDPAYPSELIREGIEGTVVLYAIIHKDGTVGDVRVLRGLQVRLNENARVALMRWKFRPGTKNGEAVDLEAIVQIPFKAARTPY